jgi:hypothetical protein
MQKHKVSIVRFEKPFESVKKTVEMAEGLKDLPSGAKVFIKPNIVFWTKAVPFPKWGVITTTRVIEDMVVLLKAHGVKRDGDDFMRLYRYRPVDPFCRQKMPHARPCRWKGRQVKTIERCAQQCGLVPAAAADAIIKANQRIGSKQKRGPHPPQNSNRRWPKARKNLLFMGPVRQVARLLPQGLIFS